MYEAHRLAEEIREFCEAVIDEGGAEYRIIVTDKAGNIAEILYDDESESWIWEEGCDERTLALRVGPIGIAGGNGE